MKGVYLSCQKRIHFTDLRNTRDLHTDYIHYGFTFGGFNTDIRDLRIYIHKKDVDLGTDFQGYGLVPISRILNSIRILKDTVIQTFNTDFKDINLHTEFEGYGF